MGTPYDPSMGAFVAVVFAIMGLVFGSFLTVVVHRLPLGLSIVAPGSACPGCGATVSARDNVPVVSYLLLAGKCRTCRSHISAEYPVVESLTAGLFVAAGLLIRPVWLGALIAVFLGVLLAAGLIDLRHRIIPNRLTYPSIVLFAVAILVIAVTGGGVSVTGAAIGLACYGGALLLVALITGGMGMGDVKLAALVGLVLGALSLHDVVAAAFLGVFAGGIGAIVALAMGKGRRSAIPFGPYLAVGAAAAALFGRPLSVWYLGLAH
jgi:leader peptidase (prepilin peptidase)/N-methyltransferase